MAGEKIEITFEKGGKFVAELFPDKAPKVCEAFLKKLPREREICHATTARGRSSVFQGESGARAYVECGETESRGHCLYRNPGMGERHDLLRRFHCLPEVPYDFLAHQ
jgi:hypothetical protein